MPIVNSSLIPVLDANTFVYAAQEKDIETLHKYLLAGLNKQARSIGLKEH